MTANNNPVFLLVPNIGTAKPTAANTKSDGTGTIGTDIYVAFTAGANGSYVSRVRFIPTATTAATATTATIARAYYSTKTSGATVGGTDTWLIGETAFPAQTADATANPIQPYEIPVGFAIPAGSTILVSTHAAPAANTVIEAMTIGGDY